MYVLTSLTYSLMSINYTTLNIIGALFTVTDDVVLCNLLSANADRQGVDISFTGCNLVIVYGY